MLLILSLVRWSGLAGNAVTRRIPILLSLVAIIAAGSLSHRSKTLADRNLWALGDEYGLSPAWKAIDALHGVHITSYGVRSLWYYPLFGRSLQNSPIYVDQRGNGRPPLHQEWKLGAFYWWQAHDEWLNPDRELSGDSLLRSLRRTGVEYVLFGIHEDSSPPQYTLLKGMPGVETVFSSTRSAVLALRPLGNGENSATRNLPNASRP
jgi:hypothetical protein